MNPLSAVRHSVNRWQRNIPLNITVGRGRNSGLQETHMRTDSASRDLRMGQHAPMVCNDMALRGGGTQVAATIVQGLL